MSTDVFEAPARRAEVKRDRYGRPLIPHPITGVNQPWTRVTTISGTLKDSYALGQWQERMVAHGLGKRKDLYALACALDPAADKKRLQEVCDKAKDAAKADEGANHGTALHAFTDTYDRTGKAPENVPDHVKPDFDAYVKGMGAANLEVFFGLLECQVVIPELDASGAFDRVLRDRVTNQLLIGDLKTGKVPYWDEIAIQLAMYAHATHVWDPDRRQYTEMPPEVDRETAVVMWLPAGQARFEAWDVDIAAGWELAKVAVNVRKYRARKDLARPRTPVIQASTWAERIASATSVAELSAVWQDAFGRGEWTQELQEQGMAKKRELASATS
jgi:hypothetical protein